MKNKLTITIAIELLIYMACICGRYLRWSAGNGPECNSNINFRNMSSGAVRGTGISIIAHSHNDNQGRRCNAAVTLRAPLEEEYFLRSYG